MMTRDDLRQMVTGGCTQAENTWIVWHRLTAQQQQVVEAINKVFATDDAVVDAVLAAVNAG